MSDPVSELKLQRESLSGPPGYGQGIGQVRLRHEPTSPALYINSKRHSDQSSARPGGGQRLQGRGASGGCATARSMKQQPGSQVADSAPLMA